jgi:hypothetical protein
MIRKGFLAASIAVLFAVAASAATITFTLDFSGGPGTFKLYADDSAGDNFGMASYGAVLTGPINAFDHSSVNTLASSGASGVGPAGFTLLRSADNIPTLLASQDTVGTANLIRGIGQTGGSLASNGITSFINPVEGDPWNAHFLIGSGTYTGGDSKAVGMNLTSADTFSNVFSAQTGGAVSGAQISLQRTGEGVIPEPTTLSLLGLAMIGGFGLVRRRAA